MVTGSAEKLGGAAALGGRSIKRRSRDAREDRSMIVENRYVERFGHRDLERALVLE